jgi:hypothetical protein
MPAEDAGQRHAGMIYGGGPSRVMRTPEGAMIELIRPGG